MSQADFIKVKNGYARVLIKTNPEDELPTFELDMPFTKANALKIVVFALQLKDREEADNE